MEYFIASAGTQDADFVRCHTITILRLIFFISSAILSGKIMCNLHNMSFVTRGFSRSVIYFTCVFISFQTVLVILFMINLII